MHDLNVSFVASRPPSSLIDENTILIWPEKPIRDNFGGGFQAGAYINGRINAATPTNFFECSLLVVPWPLEGATGFDTWLDKQLSGGLEELPVSNLGVKFFTILKKEFEYRRLMMFCEGDAQFVGRILRPMRDVVYFRSQNLEADDLKEFIRSAPVYEGVFRHASPYLAWHRAKRILSGDLAEYPINDARKNFEFSVRLPGFDDLHRLPIQFNAPEPIVDRVHALIGRNGVGKSQLLRELIVELGRRTDGVEHSAFIDGEKPRGVDVTLTPHDFHMTRVIAMSWDVSTEFPRGARLDSRFQYLHFCMNESLEHGGDQHAVDMEASETQTAMLVQLLREAELDRGQYESLRTILKPVLEVSDLAVFLEPSAEFTAGQWITLGAISSDSEPRRLDHFSRVDLYKDPMRIDSHGSRFPLSSGERTFLNFGIRCVARLIQGSLLLIDEPETHLHPNLISDFMRILAALLVRHQSIALIATHSPFVVRELPGRCVHIVRVDDDRIPTVGGAFLRTLGASVDRLAIDIFGDAESQQLNRDLAAKIAGRGLSYEEVRQMFGRDVSSEMLSEIRELMLPKADE